MEINFYHLTKTPLGKALPQLLLKVLESGSRAVVMASNDNQLKTVDDFLWTFSTNKIVPHGTMASGFAEEQPVFLTLKEENPNKADMLVTLGGVEPGFISKFNRILDIFDGNDEGEVASARARWKKYSGDASVKLTYWKQDEKGAWQKS